MSQMLLDLTPLFERQEFTLKTLLFNCEIMDRILSDTIKNEDGEVTNTVPFNDVKALATYIKTMNNINIDYLKKELDTKIRIEGKE